ncbi:MAG: DoxX family protein [Candidatus Eremiobacteraeota bacterium]|nr:DoxX family protein [Candidatus Eremiobacteraeota bacterium]
MRSSFGMLVARTIVGGGMFAHGAQKAFGWFEGSGPQKTAGFMKMLGFENAEQMGKTAAYNELISGGLIASGFLGTIGPSILIVNMLVAMSTVHKDHGFFAADNGVEVPLLYAAAALAFAAGGYGECSVDKLFGLEEFFSKRRWFYLGLGAAVGTAIAVLNQRVPPAPPPLGVEAQQPAEPQTAA